MSDAEPKRKITLPEKVKALKRHLRQYQKTITVVSVIGVISAVANGVVPYITGLFFDALLYPDTVTVPRLGTVDLWVVLLFAWSIAQLAANVLGAYIDRKSRVLTTAIEAGIQARAFKHLMTLPISFHKKNRSGEVLDLFGKASWQMSGMINVVIQLAPQFLSIAIGVLIAFYMQASLAFVLLVGVAVYLVTLARVLPKISNYQAEAHETWNRAYGDGMDTYNNVQTVKQAGAEAYEAKRIDDAYYKKTIPTWMRHEVVWSNMSTAQRIIIMVTQGAVLLYSVALVGNGSLTIGQLVAFNAYAGMIIGPFVALGQSWQTIQNALVSITRAELIFGAQPEQYVPRNAVPLPMLRGEVQFDTVHFTYEPEQPEILKGVSFRVRPGEVVAFVGETGVGKSTTVELVSGYYFATSGKVLVDGHDVRTVNLHDLRRGIGIVPQEIVLFNATIKENIRYARPEATDAEIEAVAKKAHADAFIDKFPQKYEQEVGERGVKLSVGQKQRIAIARAMLRDPQILILDEPTSALDAETEKYITASFEELMRGRTTFIIAHRLSTVRKADKIIVLKDGKVAETGNHSELMSIENGVYRHLYELHIGLHE
jgi:ABC-type multidrug transport system fused ATPase/permease subunit